MSQRGGAQRVAVLAQVPWIGAPEAEPETTEPAAPPVLLQTTEVSAAFDFAPLSVVGRDRPRCGRSVGRGHQRRTAATDARAGAATDRSTIAADRARRTEGATARPSRNGVARTRRLLITGSDSRETAAGRRRKNRRADRRRLGATSPRLDRDCFGSACRSCTACTMAPADRAAGVCWFGAAGHAEPRPGAGIRASARLHSGRRGRRTGRAARACPGRPSTTHRG